MELKELRIGNLILKNGSNYIVDTLFFVDVYDGTAMGFDLQPIPLTEEMLLKCGYATCSFRDNHFVIKGHTIWKCKDLFMCDKNGMVLKHLHQLQNLYFALTNEELTVNL